MKKCKIKQNNHIFTYISTYKWALSKCHSFCNSEWHASPLCALSRHSFLMSSVGSVFLIKHPFDVSSVRLVSVTVFNIRLSTSKLHPSLFGLGYNSQCVWKQVVKNRPSKLVLIQFASLHALGHVSHTIMQLLEQSTKQANHDSSPKVQCGKGGSFFQPINQTKQA